MVYDDKLRKFILENSESSNLEEAWLEWKPVNHNPRLKDTNIIGHYYILHNSHCRCGNKIDFCYQIKNMKTGIVFPTKKGSSLAIGSECIKKFIPGYTFSSYEHKTQLCITCNKRYKGNCTTCQINLLRGVSFCINVECKRQITENTKKKYGNKLCIKCNR
jgi:hypothetical protein